MKFTVARKMLTTQLAKTFSLAALNNHSPLRTV